MIMMMKKKKKMMMYDDSDKDVHDDDDPWRCVVPPLIILCIPVNALRPIFFVRENPRMACRCFWDENTDNYAQEVFSNVRRHE